MPLSEGKSELFRSVEYKLVYGIRQIAFRMRLREKDAQRISASGKFLNINLLRRHRRRLARILFTDEHQVTRSRQRITLLHNTMYHSQPLTTA